MSKDPAFLFYSSDFLTGTMFMDNDQVGKFIRLMCAQHQKGRLTEKDMLKICVTHDDDIFSKFAVDEAGLYYNERLEQEVVKRKAYSESRRNNRKKKEDVNDISLSYVLHMENENENENIIEDIVLDKPVDKPKTTKVFTKPTIEEIALYMEEKGMNNVSERFYNFYEAKGWMIGKNSIKNWKACVSTWKDGNLKTATATQPTQKRFNIADYE
jgi:hypothetical protein